MKISLLFLRNALLFALVLFVLKELLHPLYRACIYQLCYLLPGVVSGVTLYNDSVDKVIAFTALLLATPGISWTKKILMLTIGLGVFLVVDVTAFFFTTPLDFRQAGVHNSPPSFAYFWVWKAYGRWLLPVLLWLVTCKKYLGGFIELDRGKSNRAKVSLQGG